MKYPKSFIALLLFIFSSTSLLTAGSNLITPCCVSELNETMQAKLDLTSKQIPEILKLNQAYWNAREHILSNPEKIAKNTALVACWDNWVRNLSPRLTKAQLEIFMHWQSRVDILSSNPY